MSEETRAICDDLNGELMGLYLRPTGAKHWHEQDEALARRVDESGLIERCIPPYAPHKKQSTNHDEEVQHVRVTLWGKWHKGELTEFTCAYIGQAVRNHRQEGYRWLTWFIDLDLSDWAEDEEAENQLPPGVEERVSRFDKDERRLWDWALNEYRLDLDPPLSWYAQAMAGLLWSLTKVYAVRKRIRQKLME